MGSKPPPLISLVSFVSCGWSFPSNASMCVLVDTIIKDECFCQLSPLRAYMKRFRALCRTPLQPSPSVYTDHSKA